MGETKDWQPIAELTEEIFKEVEFTHRLIVTNDCNGPYMVSVNDLYFSADDVRNDPWDHFIILPETPSSPTRPPHD